MNQWEVLNNNKITKCVKTKEIFKKHLINTSDIIVLENKFFIDIKKIGIYKIFCTPFHLNEIAVGFMFSMGIIKSIDEIAFIEKESSDKIGITLSDYKKVKKQNISNAIYKKNKALDPSSAFSNQKPVKKQIKTPVNILSNVIDEMLSLQTVFKKTGVIQTASIYDTTQKITISFAEDYSQENALNKAIGKIIIKGYSPEGCGLAISDKIDYDIILKSVKTKIELIVSVLPPTSLAIQAAEYWNITLCSFLKKETITIYTHADRII